MDDIIPSISSKIFEIGGYSFVSGLYWRTIGKAASLSSERPTRIGKFIVSSAGEKTLTEAKNVGADMFVARRLSSTHPVQIGLGQKSNIANITKKPIYSWPHFVFQALSALNEDAQDIESICVVYPVNNERQEYLLAIQNLGSIIPAHGDHFDSLENIKDIVAQTMSMGGFRLFAPVEMEFYGAEPLPDFDVLLKALSKSISDCELLPIKPDYKKIAGYGVLLGAVAFGATTAYNAYQEKVVEARLLKAQADLEAIKAQRAQSAQPEKLFIKLKEPKAAFFACSSAFNAIRLNAGGWEYTKAICKDGVINTAYKRNGSQIKFLQSVYPSAIFSVDGEQANVVLPVNVAESTIAQDSLPAKDEIVNQLNGFAQSIGTTALVQTKSFASDAALPGRASEEVQQTKPVEIAWQMDVPFPGAVNSLNIPAATLDAVQFAKQESGSFTITIKGTSYAKR